MALPRELLMMITTLAPDLRTFHDVQLAEQRFCVAVHVRDDVRRRFRRLVKMPGSLFVAYKYVLPCQRKDGPYVDFMSGKPYIRRYYLVNVPHGMYVTWVTSAVVERYTRTHGGPVIDVYVCV